MKSYYILIVLLLLAACSSNTVRREDMIAEHPEWSADMVTLVRNGYVAKGMTMDQVKATWGRPDYFAPGTTDGEWGESWQYPTQTVVFNRQGIVVRLDKR